MGVTLKLSSFTVNPLHGAVVSIVSLFESSINKFISWHDLFFVNLSMDDLLDALTTVL